MIRAILFDFDRTLVDFVSPTGKRDAAGLFRAGASRCYAYLSAHELSLPAFDTFHRRQRRIQRKIDFATWITGGEPDTRRMLRRLCRDYGLQRDQASLAKLGWLWYEPHTERAQVASDVVPTLTAISGAGIEMGLIVNTPWQGEVIDQHLEVLGLREFFPVRVYSTDIGARKPDARLFEAALEQLHMRAAETVFVGDDAKADILGARRVGMTTVLRSADSAAQSPADRVIQNIGQLLDLPVLEHIRRPAPPSARVVAMPQLIV